MKIRFLTGNVQNIQNKVDKNSIIFLEKNFTLNNKYILERYNINLIQMIIFFSVIFRKF